MKDQATHIRIIRDENGKPFEAEYVLLADNIPEWLKKFVGFSFLDWAKANRIPVTGDWPADKNVFAKDEVKTVWQYYYNDQWEDLQDRQHAEWHKDKHGFEIRETLRLKAKQEERPKCSRCGGDRFIVYGVTPKPCPDCNGEEPKQEAKTAEGYCKIAEAFLDGSGAMIEVNQIPLILHAMEAYAEASKEQLQQELIKKLEDDKYISDGNLQRQWNAAFDYAIHLIQST